MTKIHTTIVERVHGAGFKLGPASDDPCAACGHVWGNHLLVASETGDPIDGGHAQCPFHECDCMLFWDLPEHAREIMREHRRALE